MPIRNEPRQAKDRSAGGRVLVAAPCDPTVRPGILIVLLCGMFLVPGVRAQGPLDVYRSLVGSSVETEVTRYARGCILRALDPGQAAPTPGEALANLPPTGIYLTLMHGGKVRACVGSFSADVSRVAEALARLADLLVYRDTRHPPVCLSEVEALSVVVSFVGPLREIDDPYRLDFSREGLLVVRGGTARVLLPGETRTLEHGIRTLMTNGSREPHGPCRYASFQVVAFDERRK